MISIRFYPQFFVGSIINFVVVFSSMYLLFISAAFLLGFVNLYFDIVILTNKRIVDINQNGLFNRTIDELDILHVEDVSAKVTGFFGTMLDFGCVEIQTAGTARNFIFTNIPHPREFTQKLTSEYKRLISSPSGNVALKTIDTAEGLGERAVGVFNHKDLRRPGGIANLGAEKSENLSPKSAPIEPESKPISENIPKTAPPDFQIPKIPENKNEPVLNIPETPETPEKPIEGELHEGTIVDLTVKKPDQNQNPDDK